MLHRCVNCMGHGNLENYIKSLFAADQTDDNDIIHYKQWVHDGQLKLQAMSSNVSEFTDVLYQSVDITNKHHFTCNAQSLYLRKLKESLQPMSA